MLQALINLKNVLFLLVFVCCSSIFTSLFVYSAESATNKAKVINLAAEIFPPMTNADGTGQQFEIVKAIFEPLGYTVNINIYPYRRVLHVIKTAQVDMAIGVAKETSNNILYSALPHDADNVVAIYPKYKELSWRGLASLENKRLSFIAGLTSALSQNFVGFSYQFSEVNTREQAFKKLLLGRVDFLIDCECGLLLEEVVEYREQFQARKIGFLEIYASFANTDKAKDLRAIWQQQFPLFIQTSKAKAIYKKWGLTREYAIILQVLQDKKLKHEAVAVNR